MPTSARPCSVRTAVRALATAAALAVGAAALTACGDGGGSEEAYCATARRFEADNPADAFALADPADPAATAGMLREAGDRLAAWAREAPDAIAEDVGLLAAAADGLADSFAAVAAGEAAGAGAAAPVPTAEVLDASGRVVAFTTETCGVDLAG